MADDIKLWNNSPVMVFDLADGIYAYYIPSEFNRAIIEFLQEKKWQGNIDFRLCLPGHTHWLECGILGIWTGSHCPGFTLRPHCLVKDTECSWKLYEIDIHEN